MENNKKVIKSFIVFIVFILLTLWILLKDQSAINLIDILKYVKLEYIFIGIISMLMFFYCDAINIKRTLKYLGEETTLKNDFKYSLMGFFFSSITPAASGGQPFQIYYMHKDNINVAKSTATMTLNLIATQVVTISIGIICMAINIKNINQALILLFIIGLLLNSSALTILIIAIWSKRLSSSLVKFAEKVLKAFKVKNVEEKKKKMEEQLYIYHEGAKSIKHNWKLILKCILTSTVQYLFYYSVAYWIYRALGFNQYGILKLICMQALVYETASGIPLPGAVGVSEGTYIGIFKNIYSRNMINSVTLLNRGINFYLFVIISGMVVVISHIKKKIKKDNICDTQGVDIKYS